MEIEESIRELVKEFGEHPYDINNGRCVKFAEIIRKEFEEAEEVTVGNMIEGEPPYPSKYYGHTWIKYEGEHYDAEEPEGVKDWKNLPIFNRKEQKS